MQREIKFRGISNDEHHRCIERKGQFIYGDLITYADGTRGIMDREEEWCFEVIPETVGQYTGLKDKNGKEIYEGDIVTFKHERLVEREHSELILPLDFDAIEYTRNYAVEYANTPTHYGLRLRNKKIWFMVHKMTLLMHDAEVIGNIYQNPELLKEDANG